MSDENVSNYFEKEINGWGGGADETLNIRKKDPQKRLPRHPQTKLPI